MNKPRYAFSSLFAFQLCGKHGVDWQAVRLLLVSPRSCRWAAQDVSLPSASLGSAAQHVQAVLCRNWTVSLFLTRYTPLDIFVVSWSSSDNQYTHLSVQVMTEAESLSVFSFFAFCFFFWTVKRIHKNGSLCYSNKSVVPLQSASRSFTPVSKLAKLSLLKMEIGIYLTQCSVTHHKP